MGPYLKEMLYPERERHLNEETTPGLEKESGELSAR